MTPPDDLLEVFSTSDANEVEVLRIALQDEGVKCGIEGKTQGGFTGVGVMEVKLFVRAADFRPGSDLSGKALSKTVSL